MHGARMAIESRRVQGSQWRIKELPALVIEGPTHALVAVQINTDRPFSDFTTRVPDQWTIEAAGLALESRLKNNLMRFVTPSGTLTWVAGPQQQYKSHSVGPKDTSFLSWIGTPLEMEEAHLDLILTRWNRALSEGYQAIAMARVVPPNS